MSVDIETFANECKKTIGSMRFCMRSHPTSAPSPTSASAIFLNLVFLMVSPVGVGISGKACGIDCSWIVR